MVTKNMPSATSSEKVGSWSKLFSSQRQRSYRGDLGRYTSYESKAPALEKTFTRDSYAPSRYAGMGRDYSTGEERGRGYTRRSTTLSSYDGSGRRQESTRTTSSLPRSQSMDRYADRTLRDTDAYFAHRFSSSSSSSRYTADDDEEETDVLKRVRRKLRQRSYSVDRDTISDTPFRVVPKREERFSGIISQQKQRAKLGERIEEIYNTKYTRPSSYSSTSSSVSSSFSRYLGDSSDDAYTGLDYRTLIDGIPNKYRKRGYSEDRDVSSLRSGNGVSVERELGKRATSLSRAVDHHELAFEHAKRHAYRASSHDTEYESDYKRKSAGMMRAEYGRNYVQELEMARRSGRDLTNLVLDPSDHFQPDHVRVINLSSGQQAVSYDRTRQSGHGANKHEADAAIEEVIQRTRVLEQGMYTLEDFVRANRSLFPEDTQIQQQIRFFQLSEQELVEMGQSPDAVVYGVKIKEKLIVPRGHDVTAALNRYYGNKGSCHVELEQQQSIRAHAEQEVEMSRQQTYDSIRAQVEKEFEARDAARLLGEQRHDVKQAQRDLDTRDRYAHMHSHLTPGFIKSYYVNAGLDYDSIYEISRGRRSSLGSVQSDAESVCTRTSRASSGGGASRRGGARRGPDTAPTFTAKLRPKKCEEGATVRFNASISGLPVPEVAWFKSNRLITEGGRFHISVSHKPTGYTYSTCFLCVLY
jgi:hypothetical protein